MMHFPWVRTVGLRRGAGACLGMGLLALSWAVPATALAADEVRIAGFDGRQNLLENFLAVVPETWNPPGGQPLSPLEEEYTGSNYPEVYGFIGGTIDHAGFHGLDPSGIDYFTASNGEVAVEGGVLLALMVVPEKPFSGTVSSARIQDRPAGGAAGTKQARRLILQVEGGDYYISNELTLREDQVKPESWHKWAPATTPLEIGEAAPEFTGSGVITAVGYWVYEATTAEAIPNHGVTMFELWGVPGAP